MGRYSDIYITDDNQDEEREKLCDLLNEPYYAGEFWETEIFREDKRFKKTYSEEFDCEVWVAQVFLPDYSIDCVAPIVETAIAYEFANGFMVFGFHDSLSF